MSRIPGNNRVGVSLHGSPLLAIHMNRKVKQDGLRKEEEAAQAQAQAQEKPIRKKTNRPQKALERERTD